MSWTTPAPAGAGLKPFINELVFVMPGGVGSYNGQNGVIPTVRVTLVPITGPQAGELLEDTLIFATRIVQRLRGQIGQVVFGQVREIGRAMDLEDPGPMGHQFANQYDQQFPGKLAALAAEAVKYHEMIENPQPQPQQQGWTSANQQAQQGPPPSWATAPAAPYGQQPAQPAPSQPPPWGGAQAPVQPAPSQVPANVPQPSYAPVPTEQAVIANPTEQAQTANPYSGNGAQWSPSQSVVPGVPAATQEQAGF
jgi:hypothetical protein